MKPVDILAIAAHPDDAELGCGGALILAADRGWRVALADLSEGERSSRGTPEQRQREKRAAADLIGACDRLSLGLPDTEIGPDPAQQLAVVQLIREARPRIVLAPYWSDRHPDHAAAGRLVRKACFLAGVSTLGTGSPHRPDRVFYFMVHEPFTPSFVLDIGAVWGRKMQAVAAYHSQFRSNDGGPETALSRGDFTRFLEARAIWFGAMIGARYGEPFRSRGPVPLGELPGLACAGPDRTGLPGYSTYA